MVYKKNKENLEINKVDKKYEVGKRFRNIKEGYEEKTYVYKTGFKKFCKIRKLFNIFNKLSKETTGLCIEVSRFLQFHYIRQLEQNEEITELKNTTIDHVLKVFCRIDKKDKELQNYPLLLKSFNEYLNIRKNYSLQFYNIEQFTGSTHIYESIRTDYLTNCKNHIHTNVERLIKKYFNIRFNEFIPKIWNKIHPYKRGILKSTLYGFLNYSNVTNFDYDNDYFKISEDDMTILYLVSEKIIDEIIEMSELYTFSDGDVKLHEIKNFSKCYKLFFNLNKFFISREQKQIAIVPIYDYHRKYVMIDCRTIYYLIKKYYKITFSEEEFRFAKTKNGSKLLDIWYNKLFNIKRKKIFQYSFRTNGIGTSVHISKIVKKVPKKNKDINPFIDIVPENIKNNFKNKTIIAGDPGAVNPLTSIKFNNINEFNNNERGIVSQWNSSKLYKYCGNTNLNKISNIISNNLNLQETPSIKMTNLEDIKKHLNFVFSKLENIFKHYLESNIDYVKWQNYIKTQKTYELLCREITNDDRNAIVFLGAGSFSTNMKGHVPSKYKKIKNCLKNNYDVIDINEFYTSQTCSYCLNHFGKQKGGFPKCLNTSDCGKTLNRDINSARNIMIIGIELLLGNKRPKIFTSDYLE